MLRRTLSAVCLFFCTLCCIAQQGDTVAFSVDLEEYVVTGLYKPTHTSKVIHEVQTITKEKIANIGANTLDQALSIIPSLRIYEDAVLGSSVRLRGMQASNVSIMIDGVPVIGRNNGAIDVSQISLHNIKRVEVVQGPLSTRYGNNAAGGVINLITYDTQVKTYSIDLSSQVQSTGQHNHAIRLGMRARSLLLQADARRYIYDQHPLDSLRLVSTYKDDNGEETSYRPYPFNPKKQTSYGFLSKYYFGEDHKASLSYRANEENIVDYGVVKRPRFKPYATDTYFDTKRKDYVLRYDGLLSKDFTIDNVTSYNVYNRIREQKRLLLETEQFDNNLTFVDSIQFTQLMSRANVSYTGIPLWTVGGGCQYTGETGKGDRILDRSAEDSTTVSTHDLAFYTDVQYNGFHHSQLSFSQRLIRHNLYNLAYTYALQSKTDFGENAVLRLSYAQGFRSPSLKELYLEFIDINHHIIGNPSLKPERSYDYQATYSLDIMKGLEASANAYYTEVYDRITLAEFDQLKFNYQNVERYYSYGLLPSITYSDDNWQLQSSASVSRWSARVERDMPTVEGNVFDMTNYLSYSDAKWPIGININHRWVGRQPIFRQDGEEIRVGHVSQYHLVDLSLDKSFLKKKVNVTAGVRNLLHITHATSTIGSSQAHSTQGRSAFNLGRTYFLQCRITTE